eukprot:scaffold104122_cov60-Phaeocystis_antarctica.AAC.2
MCFLISCRAPAWARSPSAVGKCPLTYEEEEEVPDWLANSPKGQVPLKLPAGSWWSALGAYLPPWLLTPLHDDARFSTMQPNLDLIST